jgi:TetR/AcrR family transcriptional regulator
MPRRGPGRPTTPLPRDALLGAARLAFAHDGYEGASLSRIARRLGITKASLLYHFPSKDALYAEVLSDTLSGLEALLPAPEPAFLEALDRLGAAVTDWLAARPEAARLLMREVLGAGPFARGPGLDAVIAVLEATSAFFARGMALGAIPPQDPTSLAVSVVSLHLTWFAAPEVVTRLGGDPFAPDAVAARRARVIDQVRRLCGAPPR